ncbi:MAG TPA: hypothetical protein PLI95_22980, partial [Polyangiaceae bacterium]|nr:hypothetical protein [Polyangiaceae bacterium]
MDLAPSMSRVRATQKYFRAMTRRGSEEAHLFVVLPKELPSPPLLPNEIMGLTGEYACGDLLDRSEPGAPARPVRQYPETPVSGVQLRQRLVVSTRLTRPTLQRGDWPAVREVLRSSGDWDENHLPSVRAFLWMVFDHPSFCGHGSFLLRWLGLPSTRVGYAALISSAFPGPDILDLVGQRSDSATADWCAEDVAVFHQGLPGERASERDVESAAIALAGGSDEPPPLQDELIELHESIVWILLTTVTCLRPNERFALIGRYGVGVEGESTYRDLVTVFGRSVERIRQLEYKARRRMEFFKHAFRSRENRWILHGSEHSGDLNAVAAAAPVNTRFLGRVLRELSLFELHVGDLDTIWDEKEERKRRARRAHTPHDPDSWTIEIRDALDYAIRSEDEARREAILVAVVVRACLYRQRPRPDAAGLLTVIRSVPDGLRGDGWREVFARWYLEAHGLAGRMPLGAVCARLRTDLKGTSSDASPGSRP